MPIAKQFKGTDFYGCLSYVLGKEKAKVLDGNLCSKNAASLAKDFEFCCQLNSRVRRKVYHAAISLPASEPMDDAQFQALARDYLIGMGFGFNPPDLSLLEKEIKTEDKKKDKHSLFTEESLAVPYIVVRHHDTEHHHIHIVAGRVRCDGSCVSDFWDYRRSERLLRLIEKQYGLSSPKSTPILQEIREKIDLAKHQSQNFGELQENLEKEQIIVYKKNRGLVYKYKNRHYQGNTIGEKYTLPSLEKELAPKGLEGYQLLPQGLTFTPFILQKLQDYPETIEKILKYSKSEIYEGKRFTIKKSLKSLTINLNEDSEEQIMWVKPQENRKWILRNFKFTAHVFRTFQEVIEQAKTTLTESLKNPPKQPPPIFNKSAYSQIFR